MYYYLEVTSSLSKDWDYLRRKYDGRKFESEAIAWQNAKAIEQIHEGCTIEVYKEYEEEN